MVSERLISEILVGTSAFHKHRRQELPPLTYLKVLMQKTLTSLSLLCMNLALWNNNSLHNSLIKNSNKAHKDTPYHQ